MRNENIEYINGGTDIISLSIGKKYMYMIADSLIKDTDFLKECHRDIDNLIGSIDNKDILNSFWLDAKIRRYFDNEDLQNELIEKLSQYELTDEDNYYLCLLKHMKNVLDELEEDKKENKIHLFLKLKPKQPDNFNPIDDLRPVYKSILSKFSLKNYKKHKKESGNSAEGWTYQLCVLYFVIINSLYGIVKPYIDSTETYLIECFITLNPVIVGFRFHVQLKLNNRSALSVIHELFQLTSKDKRLQMHKRPDISSIELIFVSKESTFSYADFQEEKTKFNGERLLKLLITGKADTVNLRIDIVGQGGLEDTTGMACKKAFFSLITDEMVLEEIGYNVLKRVLSHTNQFASVLNIANEFETAIYKQDKSRYIFENTKEAREQIKTLCKKNFIHNNVFKDLETETVLLVAKALLQEFKLSKYQIDYIIIANELAKYDNITISNEIASLGSKQQAQIRKMIDLVRNGKTNAPKYAINELFNTVSYWG